MIDDPHKCPCVENEAPVPPCDDTCFHFTGKASGFCEHCGEATFSATDVLEQPKPIEPPEVVLAYNTDGLTLIGPFLWAKKPNELYECLDDPHKGTCAHLERLKIIKTVYPETPAE